MTQEAINTYNEAYCYYTGTNGYPLNYGRALEKFNAAAQLGVSSAMNYLGVIYLEGKIVKQDYSVATDWFFKAAQTEPVDIHSMYNLGRAYYFGWGVPKNIQTAKEMFERTIAAGKDKSSPYANCCYMLGVIHTEIYKNYKEAYPLFCEAATSGNIPEAWHNIGWLLENHITLSSLKNYPERERTVERDKCARDAYEKAANLGYAASMDALGRLNLKYNQKQTARQWIEKAAKLGFEPAQKRLRLLDSTEGGSLWEMGSSLINMFKK